MFTLECESGGARTGFLNTAHGVIQTPAFMPVATKGAAKFVTQRDFEEMGVQAFILNGFIMYLRDVLDKKDFDIHDFMSWKKPVFTDCGAFQMLRSGFFRGYSKRCIHFVSPFSGKHHYLTPEKATEIQASLKSDVAMALDNVPRHGLTKDDYAKSVELTTEWHKKSKQAHEESGNEKQLLFGITQGGIYPDLREKSTREIINIGFDGYAIGGLSIGESPEKMLAALKCSTDLLPKEQMRYFMGVGHPVHMLQSIERGVDIFDSAYPTKVARHHRLFTSQGSLVIDRGIYRNDDSALDPECGCYVCRNYTKSYVYHLSKLDEPNGKILKTYHNVYFLTKLMENVRKAVKEDRFKEFKDDFLKKWGDAK
ncbi:MAG: tRNA guanosine(34) transglycosylase Tgt [Candidatus Woesearchaeota archaeon]